MCRPVSPRRKEKEEDTETGTHQAATRSAKARRLRLTCSLACRGTETIGIPIETSLIGRAIGVGRIEIVAEVAEEIARSSRTVRRGDGAVVVRQSELFLYLTCLNAAARICASVAAGRGRGRGPPREPDPVQPSAEENASSPPLDFGCAHVAVACVPIAACVAWNRGCTTAHGTPVLQSATQ